ncbi:MAG: shikimate kinase [Acidimicrobiales bacterium]
MVLVGMMGAGKSSVGRRLADRMGRPFLDTDAMVEASEHASVAEIFASRGEPAFRALERQAVRAALEGPEAAVISLGGGAVLHDDTRRDLGGGGPLVVWLRAESGTLAGRILRDDAPRARPLLDGAEGPEQGAVVLEDLRERREPLYRSLAQLVLDVDDLGVDGVVARVLQGLGGPRQPEQQAQPGRPGRPV